jgi:biopolymer transport protein ExbB
MEGMAAVLDSAEGAAAAGFLARGGPALWAIAALSVLALGVTLWKLWRLAITGAWARGRAERAVTLWQAGRRDEARALLGPGRSVTSRVLAAALDAAERLPEAAAREETARVARRALAEARAGLRALELVALIAPLLGLLGTVLGMIAAFRALEATGAAADPAVLAGGIWEALLTTAAGMAVAIPAAVALTGFESVVERLRLELEDLATRVFAVEPPAPGAAFARAAE